MPMPRDASTNRGSTPSNPVTVLATMGSAPYTVSAMTAPTPPIPNSTAPSAISPIAGAAWPKPATVMIGFE